MDTKEIDKLRQETKRKIADLLAKLHKQIGGGITEVNIEPNRWHEGIFNVTISVEIPWEEQE